MNNKYLWLLLGLLLLWIFWGGSLCKECFCGGAQNAAGIISAAKSSSTSSHLMIADEKNNYSKECLNSYNYLLSNQNYIDVDNDMKSCLDETAQYMIAHKDRKMRITGLYGATEKNTGLLENIGLSRANNLKNKFVAMGVPASQFELASQLYGGDLTDTLYNGININFIENETKTTDNRLSEIKNRLEGKPMIIYFGTNQEEVSLSDAQRKDMSDIIYYLDNAPKASIMVSGHTDNAGNRNYNLQLSAQRAAFVKNYLLKNGLNEKFLQSQGFGPDKPISENNTKEGKAKNRRVEIVLQ